MTSDTTKQPDKESSDLDKITYAETTYIGKKVRCIVNPKDVAIIISVFKDNGGFIGTTETPRNIRLSNRDNQWIAYLKTFGQI